MLKIGLSIGDVNGIGPELLLRTFQDKTFLQMADVVVYSSQQVLSFYAHLLGRQDIDYRVISSLEDMQSGTVNVLEVWQEDISVEPGKADKSLGRYTFASLQSCLNDVIAGRIDGMVTLPINKDVMSSDYFPYKGHTEFIRDQVGASDCLMFLVSSTLKIGVVTNHLALSEVNSAVTKEAICSKAELMNESLIQDFGIAEPKIAVLGLNPHAGDGGLIGREEIEIIAPAIDTLKKKGIHAEGPFPPDGFFGLQSFEGYDAVLAMYHDQGLIPFKLLHFHDGVNFTAGLPVVRTSPDHGTAYNIAGKGVAKIDSFKEAFLTAIKIGHRRNS